MQYGVRVTKWLESIRSSYWFLPGIMVVLAAAAAWFLLFLDRTLVKEYSPLFEGEADAARELLSMLAGSMMTVAGVTFSITMVVLSLASSQFGPRLLRRFMRDRVEQVVLGTFVATFTYCLIVLLLIPAGDESPVPHVALIGAVVLALASIAVFIFFIHHIARLIQAPVVISRVGSELRESIDGIFPTRLGKEPPPEARRPETRIPQHFFDQCVTARSERSGYLQAVDNEALLQLARQHDLLVRLAVRPGDYICRNSAIADIWPPEQVDDKLISSLTGAFALGDQRSMLQDVRFGIVQLVEVAARALSPGINEPFTAASCIHQLADAYGKLATCELPSAFRFDEEGVLRLWDHPLSFEELLDEGIRPLRQMGRDTPLVLAELMKALEIAGTRTDDQDRKSVIRSRLAEMRTAARRYIDDRAEVHTLEALYRQAIVRIDGGRPEVRPRPE